MSKRKAPEVRTLGEPRDHSPAQTAGSFPASQACKTLLERIGRHKARSASVVLTLMSAACVAVP